MACVTKEVQISINSFFCNEIKGTYRCQEPLSSPPQTPHPKNRSKNQSNTQVAPIIEGRPFSKPPKQRHRHYDHNRDKQSYPCDSFAPSTPTPQISSEFPGTTSFSQFFALFEHFSQQNPSFSPRFQFRASCFNPTIMQNKPNLLHTQMNVTTALTMAYRNIKPSRRLKNKPNFNPTISDPPSRL